MSWWKKRHYDKAEVKVDRDFNCKNELISERYYIEYAITILWYFKGTEKFFKRVCDWADCYTSVVYEPTAGQVILKYTIFVDKHTTHSIKQRVEPLDACEK